MARKKLTLACKENSRLVGTTSPKESVRLQGRVTEAGNVFVREVVMDVNYDHMMRNNRGVL